MWIIRCGYTIIYRMEAHGIIQTGFDISGAMRRRTVKVADFDGERLYAAFEIRV